MDTIHEGPEVYAVAGDRAQARVVFDEMRAMAQAHPELAETVKVYRNSIEFPERRAVCRVLSADAPRAQGLNPSFVIFDEVHVQPNEDLWVAMRMGMGFREQPMLLGITTAGFDKDSLAWRLYDRGKRVVSGEIDDPGFFFRWWEPADPNCDHRDRTAWAQANPAYGDFLQAGALEDDLSEPENQFRRYHLNQWTTTHAAWLPHGSWDACRDRSKVILPTDQVVLGFDGSWTNDSTALVGCRVSDGHLFVVGHWERPNDGTPWVVPESDVEKALLDAMERYDVIEVACDPAMWRAQLQRWDEMRLPVVEWPTNTLARMVPACKEFYAAVMEKRISHDGDARLARHVANAVVKEDRFGVRIVKDTSKRKIDLAVAAIIAFDRAHASASFESAYETESLLTY